MRTRIGELLLRSGALGARRLEEAYRRQVVYGGALDTVLLEMNAVEENRLRAVLAQASGLPAASPESLASSEPPPAFSPDLVATCVWLRVAPLSVGEGTLRVLVCESSDVNATAMLADVSGLRIEPCIGPEYRVTFELERLCGVPMPPRYAALARRRLGATARALFARRHGRGVEPEAATGAAEAHGTPAAAGSEMDWSFADEMAARAAGAGVPIERPGDETPPTAVAIGSGPPEPPPLEPLPLEALEPGERPAVLLTPGPAPLPPLPLEALLPPEEMPVRQAAPALQSLPAWASLQEAAGRDEIFEALCQLACARLEYAALFTIHGPSAVLRLASGLEGPAPEAEVVVALEEAAAFRTAVESGAPYLGPVDAASARVLERMGRVPMSALWLPLLVAGRVVAVLYGDHGERPPRTQDVADLSVAAAEAGRAFHTLILRAKRGLFAPAAEAPAAKIERIPSDIEVPAVAPQFAPFYSPDAAEGAGAPEVAKAPPGAEPESLADEAPAEEAAAPQPEPQREAVTVSAETAAPAAVEQEITEPMAAPAGAEAAKPEPEPKREGEAAAGVGDGIPTEILSDLPAEPPRPRRRGRRTEADSVGNNLPAVAGVAVAREAGPSTVPPDGPSVIVADDSDPDALAQAVATAAPADAQSAGAVLLEMGGNGLDALLRRFPGPLRIERRAIRGARPRVSDHGAILRALLPFGRMAVPPLVRLLGHSSADTRYYAAALLVDLGFPDVAPLLALRLYDPDDQVRQVALEFLRGLFESAPREYREVLERLRADLLDPEPLRARMAAYAAGELRDPRAVPRLIELLRHRDGRVADAAHRALVIITKQDFALSRWRWRAWWEKNRELHRIEWMLQGLAHKTAEVRLSASEELQRLTHEYFGYHFDLPKREREEARRKWVAWWEQVGRKRYALARGERSTTDPGLGPGPGS